ncbi:tRNA lysidine(34) synthetase TilS [Thiomonas sp.]|uniref:tRNA lysidine(34) synthetase TilS n=1 Tax=Thiomonas sp. TaxID=2047785 RepID=UPI0026074030|nr:tRNA lysidine(34) synthetase TilS [Thiomonas sp.]
MPPGAASPGPAHAALQRFIAQHADMAQVARVGVAFSGGADSTALLLAALSAWGARRVCALHVNHGLQPAAAEFSRHVQAFCAQHGVACVQADVQLAVQRGQSVEEQARLARYAALAGLAQQQRCGVVLLAQHGDDQVESLLLALLRGAGPRGLAAMPDRLQRHGMLFARPLLACGAAELRAWLQQQGVEYVRDPMNADPAYRRSRIRAELLPVIARLEPGYRHTLQRSATLCAAADRLIRQQAGDDLRLCAAPQGLHLAALRQLDTARRCEVLRLWLRQLGQRLDRARTEELARQIEHTGRGAHRLMLRLPQGTLRREGALLLFEPCRAGNRGE